MTWRQRVCSASATALLAALAASPGAGSASLPLVNISDVPLPGNPTRLDYQSLDLKRHLLFIAHLGDSAVIVVDTKRRRVVATIPDVSDVHGILALPQLGIAYASATGTDQIVVISETTLKVVARMDGGVYPDGMAFDPANRRLFVSDERGKTETVIDTASNRRIATIALGGEVGNTQYDPVSGHMFVNVQSLRQIVEIDPAKLVITRRTTLSSPDCIGNHGLLIDAVMHRAFIACEDSGTLLLVDMRTMLVKGSWTTGEDPDVLALDAGTRRLFVAAESGVVSVFSDDRRVAKVAQGFLAPAAHTVAVDSQTHFVYFPLENIGGKPVVRITIGAK